MQKFTKYYFLGIGGIGMSAIARYYNTKGMRVAGYDRVQSTLTKELADENITIVYDDALSAVPLQFLDLKNTLIVRTPAVPATHPQLQYFEKKGFTIKKRAEILGEITANSKAICVAGTHGKTTTSTMIAHLLQQSKVQCSAFLGGIANNYGTNLLLSNESNYVVVEADEYDRSFHHLSPYFAIITSADPDHLDIYGTPEAYCEAFEFFTSLIKAGGALLMRKDVKINPKLKKNVKFYTYSMTEKADFYAENIRFEKKELMFDFVAPTDRIADVHLGVPVQINVENAVAAMAVAWLMGVTKEELRTGISSFSGIYRRFNPVFKNEKTIFIDDYAHHPEELRASIQSIRQLYPEKQITGIFQPHLYTRTRDFASEFAEVLSLLDELILLDIYPAREEPIAGVSSELILNKVTIKNKTICDKKDLISMLEKRDLQVLLTLGAGDIENLVPQIKEMLKKKK
ncbi:UDP-N-acetylmuramate--L-alanine ligase [Bacteroidia bacterium]|nr:UDP-N-acetylmuramate--L-alanine ligase [Bacteroidia bacterium]GHV43138.1 UDP-N-acetylmuramate--L-alanine ligase [Bacteroidia bacterium]